MVLLATFKDDFERRLKLAVGEDSLSEGAIWFSLDDLYMLNHIQFFEEQIEKIKDEPMIAQERFAQNLFGFIYRNGLLYALDQRAITCMRIDSVKDAWGHRVFGDFLVHNLYKTHSNHFHIVAQYTPREYECLLELDTAPANQEDK